MWILIPNSPLKISLSRLSTVRHWFIYKQFLKKWPLKKVYASTTSSKWKISLLEANLLLLEGNGSFAVVEKTRRRKKSIQQWWIPEVMEYMETQKGRRYRSMSSLEKKESKKIGKECKSLEFLIFLFNSRLISHPPLLGRENSRLPLGALRWIPRLCHVLNLSDAPLGKKNVFPLDDPVFGN